MSLRTLSQNIYTLKRFNSTDIKYAEYWGLSFTTTGGLLSSSYYKQSRKLATDSTGAIYFTAATNLGSGGTDLLLVKMDKSGTIIWQKALGYASSSDATVAVLISSSNNIYVVGWGAATNYGMFMAKYNTSGTIIWKNSMQYNSQTTAPYYSPVGANLSPDGSTIVVCGYMPGVTYAYGYIHFWSTTDGSYIRGMRTGSNTSTTLSNWFDVAYDGTNVLALGRYNTLGNALTKLDSSLTYTTTTNRNLSGTGGIFDSFQASILLDSAGYFYLFCDAWGGVTKIDSNFNVIWSKYISSYYLHSCTIDNSNNIYMSVRGNTGTVLYLFKFNSSGTVLWTNAFNLPSSAYYSTGISADPTGASFSIHITGGTTATTNIFKLPADGSLNGGQVNFNGISYTNNTTATPAATSVATTSTFTYTNSAINSYLTSFTLVDQAVTHTTTKSAFSY